MVGSFFAALALFAVPVTLLGRGRALRDPARARATSSQAGTVAGRLYALSTVGSIVGTFLSAHRHDPAPRHAADDARLGRAARARGRARSSAAAGSSSPLAVAALLLVPAGTIKASSGLLFETESSYQYIQIVERSDGSRALKLNEGVAVHSVWHADSVLTGGVWDTFLLVPPLARPARSSGCS